MLDNVNVSNVWVQNAGDLRNALKEKVPSKIDIGPVYTQDPAKRAAYKGNSSAAEGSGFKPVERELVFDIDLTDYDDVRNSSQGAAMSRACWSLMHIAIQVRETLSNPACQAQFHPVAHDVGSTLMCVAREHAQCLCCRC